VAHFQIHSQPVDMPGGKFVNKDGVELGMSEFKGKVVLLNFWASWCAPCRVEMPSINNLQVQLGGPQFEVVAISIDLGGIPVAQKFLDDTKSDNLKLYSDKRSKFFRAVGGRGLPLTLLINPAGQEVGRVYGPTEWDSDDAINLIRHYMTETPPAADPVIETKAKKSSGTTG